MVKMARFLGFSVKILQQKSSKNHVIQQLRCTLSACNDLASSSYVTSRAVASHAYESL